MTEYWQPPRSAKWYWQRFLDHVQNYGSSRDIPGEFGTSHLSPYLAWGELSLDSYMLRYRGAVF